MEVRPRYKQTDVGVIPEDWEADRLGKIAEVVMGQSPAGTSYNQDGVGIPLINGPTEFTDKYPIKKQWTTQPTKICKAGDLLLCVRGSSTGRMNISNDEYCIGRGIAAIRAKPGADTTFITFQVDSAIQQLLALSAGSTFPNIDGKSIRSIPVPFPPLPEQQAIVAVLSDVDALITALDRLIAKKRAIKQGAMQQLLTGKTRLPGFSGAWENVVLSGLLTQKATYGIVTAGDFQTVGIPMVRGGDIKNGKIDTTLPLVSEEKSEEYSRTVLKRNDVLIALVGYPGEAAKVTTALEGANISRAVGLIRVNQKVDPDYLVCYLNSPSGRKMVLAPSAGSAQLVVNLKDLNALVLELPSMEKQHAIAAILSDVDAEIAALEARRDKTRALKQGMMQQLLTGRIRLA